jgi:hypothetical protein
LITVAAELVSAHPNSNPWPEINVGRRRAAQLPSLLITVAAELVSAHPKFINIVNNDWRRQAAQLPLFFKLVK